MTNAERTNEFLKAELLEKLTNYPAPTPVDMVAKDNLRRHIESHFIFVVVK